MSYSALGMATNDPSSCMQLYVEYQPGVNLPDALCPAPTELTGTHPPGPMFCGRGIQPMQQALKIAGLYAGAIDGVVGPGTLGGLGAVAAKYGIAWNGDPFSVGPELCAAVMKEAAAKATCPGGVLQPGCVVPPTGSVAPMPSGGGGSTIKTSAIPAGIRTMQQILRPSAPSGGTINSSNLFRPSGGSTTLAEQQSAAAVGPGGIPVWMLAVGGLAVSAGVYFAFFRH
jgi:hypothetical protein